MMVLLYAAGADAAKDGKNVAWLEMMIPSSM
jgi:hypothetical protein